MPDNQTPQSQGANAVAGSAVSIELTDIGSAGREAKVLAAIPRTGTAGMTNQTFFPDKRSVIGSAFESNLLPSPIIDIINSHDGEDALFNEVRQGKYWQKPDLFKQHLLRAVENNWVKVIQELFRKMQAVKRDCMAYYPLYKVLREILCDFHRNNNLVGLDLLVQICPDKKLLLSELIPIPQLLAYLFAHGVNPNQGESPHQDQTENYSLQGDYLLNIAINLVVPMPMVPVCFDILKVLLRAGADPRLIKRGREISVFQRLLEFDRLPGPKSINYPFMIAALKICLQAALIRGIDPDDICNEAGQKAKLNLNWNDCLAYQLYEAAKKMDKSLAAIWNGLPTPALVVSAPAVMGAAAAAGAGAGRQIDNKSEALVAKTQRVLNAYKNGGIEKTADLLFFNVTYKNQPGLAARAGIDELLKQLNTATDENLADVLNNFVKHELYKNTTQGFQALLFWLQAKAEFANPRHQLNLGMQSAPAAIGAPRLGRN